MPRDISPITIHLSLINLLSKKKKNRDERVKLPIGQKQILFAELEN